MDTCAICGDYIPEGRQICNGCGSEERQELTQALTGRPIKITIPDIPPSNNKFMGRGTKYVQSVLYQEEKQKWAWMIKTKAKTRPKKPIEKAEIKIIYYFKTHHRRDPDNYSGKFILDGLTSAGIIKDDSFSNIDLVLRGRVDRLNPRTEIYITEVAG